MQLGCRKFNYIVNRSFGTQKWTFSVSYRYRHEFVLPVIFVTEFIVEHTCFDVRKEKNTVFIEFSFSSPWIIYHT